MISDEQGAIILNEMSKHQEYQRLGKYPSETKKERTYRTRKNPFEKDMALIEHLLEQNPNLGATKIFRFLNKNGNNYQEGQIRTLQRIVRDWKVDFGPEKEIFFDQLDDE